MTARKKHIRFDWAIKRLLRNKVNYVVLEGFLSELLFQQVSIVDVLESESNQRYELDKFNRVDILVKSSTDELFLIEVQNDSEYDYFHRMAYGASKLVVEYIAMGEPYGALKKVYCIGIVYFQLGVGSDYIYLGRNEFHGLHDHELLQLNPKQQALYDKEAVADIFPTYYLLKVNNFDKVATATLDEWIYFLKTSEIPDNVNAQGLKEAKEVLLIDSLTPEQLTDYNHHLENLRYEASRVETLRVDAEDKIRTEERKIAAIQIEEERQRTEEERQRAEEAMKREEEERQRAEEAMKREEEERQRAEKALKREEEERQRAEEALKREEEAIEEKEKAQSKIARMILKRLNAGMNVDEIAADLEINATEIQRMIDCNQL